MPGSVNVELKGNIIYATYVGEMNIELVKKAATSIEEYIKRTANSRILYNTLQMENPPMKLALEMQAFDKRIKDKVEKSATVVPTATTAFMAAIAFVLSKNHKVFYNDFEGAEKWLKS